MVTHKDIVDCEWFSGMSVHSHTLTADIFLCVLVSLISKAFVRFDTPYTQTSVSTERRRHYKDNLQMEQPSQF